jgi:hypothetical protein
VANQSRPLPHAVDPDRLRSELDLAMERYMAQTISTVSQVANTTQDRHIRQVCLYWKIRALDNYLQILSVEDPRLAFIQEWFGVVRIRQYLTEAPGSTLFGPDQPKIVALVKGIETDIVALGRRAFPPGAIEDAQDDIEEAANQYRAQGAFDPQPLLAPQQQGHILAILALPLAPVAGGMSDAARAINRFTDAARDFSLVVHHLPERTRWQSEVLLLEMEATGPVPALTREMGLFEKELRDAAASVLSLPQATRLEFEKTMSALDKTQPQLQATLTQAAAVAQQTQAAAETTRQGLLEFRQTAQTVGTVSDQLTQTAQAVSATAVEVRGLLADYGQMLGAKALQPTSSPSLSGAPPASAPAGAAPPAPAADIQDYRAAAESIRAAAKEIRSVLSDLQQPIPPHSGIHQVAGEFRDVLDTSFWRGVLLAVVVFALALLYRWLVRAVPGLRPRPEPPGPKG